MEPIDPAGRPFDDLVLTFVNGVVRAARRRDHSFGDVGDCGQDIRGDWNLRTDVLISAVDCLRLLKLQPEFSFDQDFEAFAEALRTAWRNDACPQINRVDRLWRCAGAALLAHKERMRRQGRSPAVAAPMGTAHGASP